MKLNIDIGIELNIRWTRDWSRGWQKVVRMRSRFDGFFKTDTDNSIQNITSLRKKQIEERGSDNNRKILWKIGGGNRLQ